MPVDSATRPNLENKVRSTFVQASGYDRPAVWRQNLVTQCWDNQIVSFHSNDCFAKDRNANRIDAKDGVREEGCSHILKLVSIRARVNHEILGTFHLWHGTLDIGDVDEASLRLKLIIQRNRVIELTREDSILREV